MLATPSSPPRFISAVRGGVPWWILSFEMTNIFIIERCIQHKWGDRTGGKKQIPQLRFLACSVKLLMGGGGVNSNGMEFIWDLNNVVICRHVGRTSTREQIQCKPWEGGGGKIQWNQHFSLLFLADCDLTFLPIGRQITSPDLWLAWLTYTRLPPVSPVAAFLEGLLPRRSSRSPATRNTHSPVPPFPHRTAAVWHSAKFSPSSFRDTSRCYQNLC